MTTAHRPPHPGGPSRPATPQPWIEQAICQHDTNPELFFPPPGTRHHAYGKPNHRPEAAQNCPICICAQCPVTTECLKYALKHQEQYGIWGGHTEYQRRALTRTNNTNTPTWAPVCGTDAGAHRHYRLAERCCEPCRQARVQASRLRRAARGEQ